MRGQRSVVEASGTANLLDAAIRWTTDERQEALTQAQALGGIGDGYAMAGDDLRNAPGLLERTSREASPSSYCIHWAEAMTPPASWRRHALSACEGFGGAGRRGYGTTNLSEGFDH